MVCMSSIRPIISHSKTTLSMHHPLAWSRLISSRLADVISDLTGDSSPHDTFHCLLMVVTNEEKILCPRRPPRSFGAWREAWDPDIVLNAKKSFRGLHLGYQHS